MDSAMCRPRGRHISVCRKFAFSPVIACLTVLRQLQNSTAGWGHPALRGNKKLSCGRGGACPARGFMAITILRVTRRHGYYATRKPPGYCDIPGKPHGTHICVPYKPAGKLHFPQLLLAFRLFVGRGLDPSLPPSQWYDISENRAPFGAILCAARSQRCGWVKTHPYNTTRRRASSTNCGTHVCVPYELTR